MARASIREIDIDDILFNPVPVDILRELDNLMKVFEEKFMIPSIIHEKSEVIFNPSFGIPSLIVDGADADIIIDGILYNFKTSISKSFNRKDNLQLIGSIS